ncbi:MAG TPA: PAS domain-containing protein [Longimicrobiaceae bacterium]|nr:PAS domain-containing protein [Longimicrobiaceae bacterium]
MMEPVEALEYVSDGVVVLDGEWRFTYLNRRASMLFRMKEEELLGSAWWDVFPYLADAPAGEELRRSRDATVPRRMRIFHPPLYAWHEVRAVPSGDGLLLVLRDVSDEARLQQTEAVRTAVREIFEQVPVAVSVLRGPDHRVEIMNAAARQLLGGRDMEGRSVRSALPELEGQGFFELLDQVYSTGKPFEGREVPVRFDRRGDGTMDEGCFNILYQPLLDNTGRVSGVLSVSLEVTDLVRQREEVERRALEQAAVLCQLVEGVVVTDAGGRVTLVNDAAERLHGEPRHGSEAGGYADAYELLGPDGAPMPPGGDPLARAVATGETVRGARWRIRRVDGAEVAVEGDARPVTLPDGTVVAAVLTLREAASS